MWDRFNNDASKRFANDILRITKIKLKKTTNIISNAGVPIETKVQFLKKRDAKEYFDYI